MCRSARSRCIASAGELVAAEAAADYEQVLQRTFSLATRPSFRAST